MTYHDDIMGDIDVQIKIKCYGSKQIGKMMEKVRQEKYDLPGKVVTMGSEYLMREFNWVLKKYSDSRSEKTKKKVLNWLRAHKDQVSFTIYFHNLKKERDMSANEFAKRVLGEDLE